MVRPENIESFRFRMILFGDDLWGDVLAEKAPYVNDDSGLTMKPFLVKPHPLLLGYYPELTVQGALPHKGEAAWFEYPIDLIDDPNSAKSHSIVRPRCSIDGKKTYYQELNKRHTDEIAQ